jgi:hypothetical protein
VPVQVQFELVAFESRNAVLHTDIEINLLTTLQPVFHKMREGHSSHPNVIIKRTISNEV